MKTVPGPSTPTSPVPIDMYFEEIRLKTFDGNWPLTFIEPRILAKTGFYFIGPFDQVKCQFCKVQIINWEHGDNEVDEHKRWSPNCPFLKRRKTDNVPLEPITELDQLLPPLSFDICGTMGISTYDVRPGSVVESSYNETPTTPNNESATITIRATKYPEYAIEADRLRSFEDWPKAKKQTPEILSDAGFYYSQCGDRVKCFSCGGSLRDWDDQDDPWEQHALWFAKCDYLRLVKGDEFIDSIKAKYEKLLSGESTASESASQELTSSSSNLSSSSNAESTGTALCTVSEGNDIKSPCDSRLCKICYTSEYNTVFVPCGHVIACGKCASSMTTCPLCRKNFDNILRIFFS